MSSQVQEGNSWHKKKIDNYVILNKKLGEGAFGTVFLGYMKTPEGQVRIAVKTVEMEKIDKNKKILEYVKRESDILKKIQHPNIVRLYDANRTQHNIYMFLEYCQDGDLKKYMDKKKEKHLCEIESVVFFKHIVEGFKVLFGKKIIHRDIKPENILLSNGVAKISDFGFARVIEADEPSKLSRSGSPVYMAPQILNGQPFSSKCDIWSLGIMFYQLLYGKTPWIGENQFQIEQAIQSKPLKFPPKPIRSQKVKELIVRMLQIEEQDRISWPELFEHKLTKMDENVLRDNMKEIMNVQDPLSRSLSLNKMYLDQNLVLGYMYSNVEEYNQNKDLEGVQLIFSSDENEDAIIQQYQKEVKRRETFKSFYSYYLFERNIALFLNFSLQKIIKLQTFQDIQIEKQLYYKLIFMLTRNAMQHLNRIQQALISNQNPNFDQEMWGRFLLTLNCKRILQAVIKDTKSVSDIFVLIQDKCEDLKQFVTQDIDIQKFLEQYKLTIQKAIDMIKSLLNIGKDAYLCIYYLKICLNPYQYFTNVTFDFNNFYEELENQSIEEILQELKL